MKYKILSIAMLLCATIFMACSNIIDELTVEVEEKFEAQTENLSVTSDSSSTITTVTSATSSNTGIVTVTKNEDGSITLKSQSKGTTTLTVTGTDESGKTVTITYTVTVAADGKISVTKSTGTDNSGGDDTIVFVSQTEELSVTSDSSITTVTLAESANTEIVTATKNEDGSITLKSQSAGTTTLTVTGTDESGKTVTITYTVTVAADGKISVTKSTGTDNSGGDDTIVFVSQTKELSVTSDSSITTVTLAESANTEIVTVLKFDDDSIVLKSQSAGTTTLTVEGTDESGEPVTINYTVTVAADGTITLSKSTNTGNTDTGNTEPHYIYISARSIKHGTVSASAEEATAGTEITLSATPANGYKLASYSVSTTGTPVDVKNGKFIMPDTPVDVSAVFTPDLRIEINYGGLYTAYNTILDFSKSGSTYEYLSPEEEEMILFADRGATLTVSGTKLTLHVNAMYDDTYDYDIVVDTESKTYTVSKKSYYGSDITIKSWTEYGTDSSTDLSTEWTVVAPVNNISVDPVESDIELGTRNEESEKIFEISGGLDGYDYTNIVWYVDGTVIKDENSVKGFRLDGTKLYYVNSDLKANHTYDVYVELTQNGRTYSATEQVTKE